MKKTVISVVLFGLFSTGNVYSAESSKNEDLLNNVLQQLINKESKQNNKIKEETNKNTTSGKVEVATKKKVENVIKEKNLIQDNYTEVVEQPEVQLIEKKTLEKNLNERISNQDLTIEDIHDGEKTIDYSKQNNMFLLNIPSDTKVRANVDLVLPPYREKLSYYKGKLVAESPFSNSTSATYCYLVLEPSGYWRRFKSENSKYLTVLSNVSQKKTYQSNINENSKLVYTHETVFTFDNKHIKNLVCESSEKSLPLTIKDVHDATGNLFSFEITPMIDI